jgi:hypothetical protein
MITGEDPEVFWRMVSAAPAFIVSSSLGPRFFPHPMGETT